MSLRVVRPIRGGLPCALGLVLAWALIAAPARTDEPAGIRKVATVEGITEYRLDNGLRVLLFPDNSRPTVTVNLTVLVGSRHEGYGETGMAHLLEHMVFKGTPSHANIPKELQQHGATWNGSTSTDRTNYFETLPASDENLEWAVGLEADRLVNSSIRREDLASEMTVVRNEFESGENSPQSVLEDKMLAAAFEWHNYGKSTIGNRSDIERVPIENLQAFYRKYYQPDNAVVIIGGRFDQEKTLALVRRTFGAIPRPARKLDATYTDEPPQDGEREVILRRVGKGAVVGAMYHVPAGPHPEFPAVEVLASILSSAPSGRLYQALVEPRKATRVSASAFAWHDPSVLQLTADVSPGVPPEEVREIVARAAETIAETGVTDAEVERARRELLARRQRSADDTARLAVALSNWAAQGDWRLYFLSRDRLEKVTAADVKAVAARYLRRSNRTVGIYLPSEKPDRVAVAPTPDLEAQLAGYTGRAVAAEGEALDPSPLSIEARVRRSTLPGGIKAVLLPKKTRGEVAELRLTLRYGDLESLKGMKSAADLLGPLMNRGTRKHSYQSLREELDRLNATLIVGAAGGGFRGRRGGGGGGSSLGVLNLTASCPRASLPAVLDLAREVLREPALLPAEFELVKRDELASLERGRTEPAALAANRLARALSPFASDDPRYTPTVDEQIERLRAVTFDQVRQLYDQYIGARAGELVVVGDFDPDATLKSVAGMLEGWKASKPYARIDTPAREVRGAREVIVTPDKANAVYQAGVAITMKDDDPDYPALILANFTLGGGSLSSRLGERIRQREGLSYGVGSSFSASPFSPGTSLRMQAICNPANIGRVETAAREELERLVREGVTEAELQAARSGYLEAGKRGRSTEAALVGMLGSLAYAGRTAAYQAEFEKKIEAVTPSQLTTALRRHVDPSKLVVVIAGDFNAAVAGGK
jgi:zinc protease